MKSTGWIGGSNILCLFQQLRNCYFSGKPDQRAEMAASADLGIWTSCLPKTNEQRERGSGRSRKSQGRLATCELSLKSFTCFSVFWAPCHLRSTTYTYSNMFLTSGMQGHFAVLISFKMVLHAQTAILVLTFIFSKHSSAWHSLQMSRLYQRSYYMGTLNRQLTHSLEVHLSVTENSVLWVTAVPYWLDFTKKSVALDVGQNVR